METDATPCDDIWDAWVAMTVGIVGWSCFVIAFSFLVTALVFENRRLKKVQNEIIILRTSSRRDFAAVSPAMPINIILSQPSNHAPQIYNSNAYNTGPNINSNDAYRPAHQNYNNETYSPEPEAQTPTRIFPNSFSYTGGMPLERQGSFASSQNAGSYAQQSTSTGQQRWTPSLQPFADNS